MNLNPSCFDIACSVRPSGEIAQIDLNLRSHIKTTHSSSLLLETVPHDKDKYIFTWFHPSSNRKGMVQLKGRIRVHDWKLLDRNRRRKFLSSRIYLVQINDN